MTHGVSVISSRSVIVGGGEGRGMMRGRGKGGQYVWSNSMPDGQKNWIFGRASGHSIFAQIELGVERSFILVACTHKEVCGGDEGGS